MKRFKRIPYQYKQREDRFPIYTFKSPYLRKVKSKPISEVTEGTRSLLQNMAFTMLRNGGTSIAAPQIGRPLRAIVVFDERFGLVSMVNPKITEVHGETVAAENCLSFPGLASVCYRAEKVRVSFKDVDNKEVEASFDGQASVAIQHAVDLLDGVLMDRRNKQTQKRYAQELNHFANSLSTPPKVIDDLEINK